MSERMNKYKRKLKALAQCSPERVRRMIRKGDDDFILAILDAVWTTLDGRVVKILPEQREKIRSVQSVLRRFASRGQSVEERRQKLLTRKGIHAIQTVFEILQTHF